MNRLIFILLMLMQTVCVWSATVKGKPFTRLFTPAEYGAHLRNFDIVCDKKGDVYVANFEGLLVYDHARWNVYHTPNITRIISLKVLPNDRVLAFDHLKNVLEYVDGKLETYKGKIVPSSEVIPEEKRVYDGRGGVWRITETGILYSTHNSEYSCFDETDGLQGEVLSMLYKDDVLYAGTVKGLFKLEQHTRRGHTAGGSDSVNVFRPIRGINVACWNMDDVGDGSFLAATAQGVFRVKNGRAERLTVKNALTVTFDGKSGFYTGELDGVCHYLNFNNESGGMIYPMENPTRIVLDKEGNLWANSMYGEVICKFHDASEFKVIAGGKNGIVESIGAIVQQNGNIYVNSPDNTYMWDYKRGKLIKYTLIDKSPDFYYIHFTYNSSDRINWMSGHNGKGIEAFKNRHYCTALNKWTVPFEQLSVRAMAVTDDFIAVGGNFGIYCIDKRRISYKFSQPLAFMRSLNVQNDDVEISFATDRESLPGQTMYSYRVDDEDWSEYSPKTVIELQNIIPGPHTFQVKCRDMFGTVSDVVEKDFYIEPPFYLKWYSLLFTFLLFLLIIYIFIKWRTIRIQQANIRLEKLVNQRTKELREAQNMLVRQEKLAMMGKLIQGLIDRLLNPLNYILNFTKLTQGLEKDLKEDIVDEKENMNEDNYDDCMDIVNMVDDNLHKIEEHSTSTTRILKAMEALIAGGEENRHDVDIVYVLRQCLDMTRKYYDSEIKAMDIDVSLYTDLDGLQMNIDADKIGMSLRSVISNSLYAIQKKYEKNAYKPKLEMTLSTLDQYVCITITDNGIGIQDSVKDKIFDPFFTTKPTSVASGVGLYLVKEIIQNHNGEITAESEYGQFTRVNIRIPRTS